MTYRIFESERAAFDETAPTRVFGILAQRGAGKTYAAMRLVEAFLDNDDPVIVIDPVGVWWALRLREDGWTPTRYNIPVLGGAAEHRDLDLEETHGVVVAEALAKSGSSCVLDVSGFRSKASVRRFVADFAETFFHAKAANKVPVHIVLEEAQEVAPQRIPKGAERMLGAIETMVKLGRSRGIGATLISQRPQSVNKDVLNQADALICLRTMGHQEREAIEKWVKENEGPEGLQRGLLRDLSRLQVGEVVVWSPGWVGIYERTRVLPKKTFDGSKTPTKDMQNKGERVIAPLDLTELKALMTAVAPKKNISNGIVTETQVVKVLRDEMGAMRTEIANLKGENARLLAELAGEPERYRKVAARLRELADSIEPVLKAPRTQTFSHPRPSARSVLDPGLILRKVARAEIEKGTLRKGAIRMRDELARWRNVRTHLTKVQLATLVGMTSTGGTFQQYLGMLKREGQIEIAGERVALTSHGFNCAAMEHPVARESNAILSAFGEVLRKGQRAMLHALANFDVRQGAVYVKTDPRRPMILVDDLAAALDMTATGGTFQQYLGGLVRLELVEKIGTSAGQAVALAAWVALAKAPEIDEARA